MSQYKEWHALDVAPDQGAAIQHELVSHLQCTPIQHPINYVGGADVSYDIGSNLISAAICILDVDSLSLEYVSLVRRRVSFPYISGMLAFRELPPLIGAWQQIPPSLTPDIMVFDGHGTVHPRSMGLACHAGLWFQVPSFGIAKNPLFGDYTLPDKTKGSYQRITHPEGHLIGYVLRSRAAVKPVYVSAGHLMTQEEARKWALHCSPRYRICEPIRQAHEWANKLRTKKEKPGFRQASPDVE